MALTHREAMKRKKEAIAEITEKMQEAKIAILTDYRGEGGGMTVKAITDLRGRLRESKGEYKIYKNTLCNIAFKELGADALLDHLKQPTAIAFGYEDPAATSKAIVEFIKEQKKDTSLPRIKAAYMDGQLFDEAQVKVLATLPSRDELLAMLLRTMNGPLQNFVNVCAGVPRAFVTVLDKIREQKESA